MGEQDDYRPTDGVEGAVARLMDDACLGYRADDLDIAAAEVCEALGRMDAEDRRALLDALGHSDCVPRKTHLHLDDHYRIVNEWQDRAERAEREREELRACVRRVEAERDSQAEKRQRAERERNRALSDLRGAYRILHDALTRAIPDAQADADADAEPPTPEAEWQHNFMPSSLYSNCALCWKPPTHELHTAMDCGHDSINYSYVLGQCRACDVEHAEPSRAEGGQLGWCRTHEQYDHCCGTAGGRPREADPQGPSIRTGDASVDGGGDDGRSRADEAIVSAICDRFGGGTPLLDSNIPVGDLARTAIDAALDSGGVVTAEQQTATGVELAEERARRQYDEARVRQLEAALRQIANHEPDPRSVGAGAFYAARGIARDVLKGDL